jgi:hypothetical protein
MEAQTMSEPTAHRRKTEALEGQERPRLGVGARMRSIFIVVLAVCAPAAHAVAQPRDVALYDDPERLRLAAAHVPVARVVASTGRERGRSTHRVRRRSSRRA